MLIYECALPFPPSVNTAYGQRSNRRRFKSKQYKAWLAQCPNLVLPECGAIDFPVHVSYRLYLPDKRRRDASNYVKVVEDFLVDQCVLFDDKHDIVQSISVRAVGIDRGNPRVEVAIYQSPLTDIRQI